MLNLTDSDMQALFEYKENLPSLDSTLELKPEYDTNFISNHNSSRDLDFNELSLNLEKVANKDPQTSKFVRMEYDTQRDSNFKDFLETIEEAEHTDSESENRPSLKFDYVPSAKNPQEKTSPKTRCISSMYQSKVSKSIYGEKAKVKKIRSKLSPPSNSSKIPKLRRESIGSPKMVPKPKCSNHERVGSTTLLRMPTPTKTCKFMSNYKMVS